jgi:hypothetical protein
VKKSLIACLACVGLLSAGVATAAADATNPTAVAAKQCNAQKKADPAAFEAAWGDKHTMQNCKKATAPEAEDTVQNASQECRAERELDPVGFQTTYGTNGADTGNGKGDGKNAFGKCVSSKSNAAVEEAVTEFKNAAKECRAERTADPAAFTATYGTNGNKKNAFGKCVSSKVKDDSDEVAA